LAAAAPCQAVKPESLVSPWLSGLLDPADYPNLQWEISRGCPYSCAYCYESRGIKGTRSFPLERVAAELALFAEGGVEEVDVLDPTFNVDRGRAVNLLKLFMELAPETRFNLELRAELLDREQARLFAQFPCSVQVGLQSADPDVMRNLNRPFDPAVFSRKVRLLDEAGAIYGFDLIYGLPGDTLAGFEKSLAFALELRPNNLELFKLSVLPGTPLAERAAEFSLDYDAEAPYHVRSSPGFPAADLRRAESLAQAADAFYNRGRAVAWFLPVLNALRLDPLRFLRAVDESLSSADRAYFCREGDDAPADYSLRLEDWSLGVLKEAARRQGKESLYLAIEALVRLHGAYSRALAEGTPSVIDIAYDPDVLLGPESLDLVGLVKRHQQRHHRIWVGEDEEGEITYEPYSGGNHDRHP
jgi:hypothetical protein